MSVNLDKLEKLFKAAQMHPLEERMDFIDAACEGDEALRTELVSLIRAHEAANKDSFLDDPVAGKTGVLPPEVMSPGEGSARRGETIGPYTIVRLLGRGGMGDVYLASQEVPFKRLVALKIIRRGMDTDEVVQRFEMERQILAALDHPNIARLLDGGVTENQLPYFALEYIDGLPITEYCDKNRLTIRERVELFRTVCNTVHYAHQNLVIHRDLKPTNILVTPERQVKLLDFGIAKLLNPSLSSVSAPLTRDEGRLMTPEYASPEQVLGESLSTASDVYSLGVILYELLAGRRPYDLSKKSRVDIEKFVQEVDPQRPSTLITRTASGLDRPESHEDALTSISSNRDSPIDKIVRQLRGDLDNIVMMALRKEPARRYGSSGQLSHDLGNFLNDMPVIAHRDTRSYRLGKFLKRHRVETAAIGVAVIALLGFSIVTAIQSGQISRERDRAQLEATKAQQVTDFVLSLFENADPSVSGDSVLVKSVLESGALRVQQDLADQPEVQAEMLRVIGQAYSSLGDVSRSIEMYETALSSARMSGDTESSEYFTTLFRLAAAYEQSHRLEDAKTLFNEYLVLAETLYGAESPQTLTGLYHVGYIAHVSGNAQTADSIFHRLEELQGSIGVVDDPDLARSLASMAEISLIQREVVRAERYARDALQIERRLNGSNPTSSLSRAMVTLAWVLIVSNQFSEAERLSREALEINSRLFPQGHRELSHNMTILGESLMELKRYSEAEELYRNALEMSTDLFGARHPSVARIYTQLGRLQRRRGDYNEAVAMYEKSIDIYRSMFGGDYLVVLQTIEDQAYAYRLAGDFEDSERLYKHSFERLRDTRGIDSQHTQDALKKLIALYDDWGRAEQASVFREMIQ